MKNPIVTALVTVFNLSFILFALTHCASAPQAYRADASPVPREFSWPSCGQDPSSIEEAEIQKFRGDPGYEADHAKWEKNPHAYCEERKEFRDKPGRVRDRTLDVRTSAPLETR